MKNLIRKKELSLIVSAIEKKLHFHILDVKAISDFNNLVYKLDADRGQYVLKILIGKDTKRNLDHFYFRKLGKIIPELNGLTLFSKSRGAIKHSFSVSKYIDGIPLSAVLYGGRDYKEIANSLLVFYKRFSSVKVYGYGNADSRFRGSRTCWLDAIWHQCMKIKNRFATLDFQDGDKYLDLLKNNLDLIDRKFCPTFFPADFNLSNFLLIGEHDIRVIESGYYYIGDPLVPSGALISHAYGTELGKRMLARIKKRDLKTVYFYAMLEALSMWSYAFAMSKENPIKAKPFGNVVSWRDIVEELHKRLSCQDV